MKKQELLDRLKGHHSCVLAERRAEMIYDEYLKMAVEGNMDEITFSYDTYVSGSCEDYYKWEVELMMILIYEKVSHISPRALLFSLKEGNGVGFEVSASNKSLPMAHIGECYIYGIK